jgi:N-acyl-D-amino-acid deacylase
MGLAAVSGLWALSFQGGVAQGSEKPVVADQRKVAEAAARGLAVVQKAAAKYPTHRDCFSCHHQTLPMLAAVSARQHQLPIEEKLVGEQAKFTRDSFDGKLADLQAGKNIGGRSMTVGYALWALALADEKAYETTEAMVTYLLKNQRAEGYWTGQVSRPPLEDSYMTATLLAIQGMKRYATKTHRDEVESAITKAKTWLEAAPAKSQEDKAARLWGLHLVDCKPEQIQAARDAVLKSQHADGGWAQLDNMNSDAYATGQTLYVLQATGHDSADESYQRGVHFLLSTQRADGSWLVVSRSKPIQTYYAFDDEDRLGRNQFISVPATSWATAALAAAVQQSPVPEKKERGRLIRAEEAVPTRGPWGEWHRYFRGDTHGTKDMVVLAVTLKPGQAPHPPHQHAEEEFMILVEGTGTWTLDGKEMPARKGDVVYAAPWTMHGLKNTGDAPLTYYMVKWNNKGVQAPEKPAERR